MTGFKIEVPNDYFARIAAKEYSDDAGLALVREFAQNSTDAGATEVRFDFETSTNVLRVSDNGDGCSAERVRNHLLKPLGSAKQNDSVGGFGKAKELLYFANPAWLIRSRDVRVEGSFLDVKSFVTGVQQEYHGFYAEVQLPPSLFAAARRSVRHFCVCSERPGVEWRVDGDVVQTRVSRPSRATKDFGFAKAYIDKNVDDDTRVYLRTGGLLTSTRWGHQEASIGRVIIEVIGKSFDLLTPARDWFRSSDHRKVVESWLNQLVTDAREAQAEEVGDEIKFFDFEEPTIDEKTKELIDQHLTKHADGQRDVNAAFERAEVSPVAAAQGIAVSMYGAASQADVAIAALSRGTLQSPPRATKRDGFDMGLLPHVVGVNRVVVHTGGKEQARVAGRWLKKNAEDAKSLLAAWATALRVVTLRARLPIDSIGFTFRTGTEAEFFRKGNRFAFMVNPTTVDLSAPDVADELLDRALHEVAHLVAGGGHNETFVLAEFDLRRKVRGPVCVGAIARAMRRSVSIPAEVASAIDMDANG